MLDMRRIRTGRATYPGGQRLIAVAAALLTACGVTGVVPAAAQAGSASTPTWTQQAPANHPAARIDQAMAYDTATGTVVLFGGFGRRLNELGDTWTWDGTTWTQQRPAVHPSARALMPMAYDAVTGTVVLFSGSSSHGSPADTWTWDGTTWTGQAPATSPPGLAAAGMAYDAATGTLVLFGGYDYGNGGRAFVHDSTATWTWG